VRVCARSPYPASSPAEMRSRFARRATASSGAAVKRWPLSAPHSMGSRSCSYRPACWSPFGRGIPGWVVVA
jgi:hypothetical protein